MATWHNVWHMPPGQATRTCSAWYAVWHALTLVVFPETTRQDVFSWLGTASVRRTISTTTLLDAQGQSSSRIVSDDLKVYWPD
jgi:hypothetical protein